MRKMIAALLFLTSAAAGAENRFCIGGDLQHLSPVQRTVCQAKLNQVRSAVQQELGLDKWHFVVVCVEAGWTDYASFSNHSADAVLHADADSDAAAKSVYLRGSRLLSTAGVTDLLTKELSIPRENGTIQLASR